MKLDGAVLILSLILTILYFLLAFTFVVVFLVMINFAGGIISALTFVSFIAITRYLYKYIIEY